MMTVGGAAPDPFEPPGAEWQPVEARLIRLRWCLLAAFFGPLAGFGLGLGVILGQLWLVLTAAAVAVLAAGLAWRVPRQVRALGYAIRDGDVLKRSGLLFRDLQIVPDVRIQYVDIDAGPVQRAFGLASLSVHTAAAGVAISLPGLAPETAARLRDQLTARDKLLPAGAADPADPAPEGWADPAGPA
ncbi:MAG: PH domain-containing protein [Propionibacteriaceae bacterium]|nr:PH domain-containing protein [Propionibacteriaceae bacterium]